MAKLYYFLYTLLLVILLPFAILRLFKKSLKNPDYRKRIGERLAIYHNKSDTVDIWIHAVSVGEFLAVKPLIERLLATQQYRILVTTTTPTGSKFVTDSFNEHSGNQVKHVYLPFDLPFFNQRFIKQFSPKVAVFVETEIWPNLIHQLKQRSIPSLLINARLSERSFNRYQKLSGFSHAVFSELTLIACQNDASQARFQMLSGNAKTIGNIKFDLTIPVDIEEKQQIIQSLTNGRDYILFASTHEKEEEILLNQLPSNLDKLVVIAPRHPERSAEILTLCQKMGFNTGLISQTNQVSNEQVLILDSLGQLLSYYSLAKLAVIGGSFVNHGGHNPLEASLFKTPCVIGEHYFNFQTLVDEMLNAEAILVIDKSELAATIENCNSAQYQTLANNAHQYLLTNQGALERYQGLIEEFLTDC